MTYVGETRHSSYLKLKIAGLKESQLRIAIDAYVSAYGNKRYFSKDEKTSLKYLRGLAVFLNRVQSERGWFKVWAHEQRKRALESELNLNWRSRLFFSSTLARAWDQGVKDDAVVAQTKKTIDIWMSRFEVSPSLLHDVGVILRTQLPKVVVANIPEIILDCKGCLEATIEQGGVTTGIKQLVEECVDAYGMTTKEYNDMMPLTDYSIVEMAANLVCHPTPLEPVTIKEIGNKIRIVTKHPAGELILNRHITSTWTKILFQHPAVRKLKDEIEFSLKPERGSNTPVLYSADLSQATDFIPHALAQRIASEWMEYYWPGSWMNAKILGSLGPHHLYTNETSAEARTQYRMETPLTKRGIHMGLGSSWTILNLINIIAAQMAGAPSGSYAVCGDDLIGFWQPETISRYNTAIESMGLALNHSKSFVSKFSGVFCERLTVVSGKGHHMKATVLKPHKLSTKHAARYAFGFKDNLIGQLGGLERDHEYWKRFKAPRLPMNYRGGSGRKPNRKDIREALKRGSKPLSTRKFVENELYNESKAMVKSAGPQKDPTDLPLSLIEPWLLRELGRVQVYSAILGELPKISRNAVLGSVKQVTAEEYIRQSKSLPRNKLTKKQMNLVWHAPWKALQRKEKWIPENVVYDLFSKFPTEQASDGANIAWSVLLQTKVETPFIGDHL
jgi:hypothetical protein